jgi:hypothetical protein
MDADMQSNERAVKQKKKPASGRAKEQEGD